jgi:ATP-dependent helicase/nuclease subunit B
MPETIFLKSPQPLAAQVAAHLLERSGNDLRRVEVWVPTAGAARRIRHALAERGVLSPHFTQPMRALLPEAADLAQRFEREAAWARVLRDANPDLLEPLFSDALLDSTDARLKSAGVLCDLADLLAESSCNPCEPRLLEICAEDAHRWEALAELHRGYLAVLKRHGLRDPNEARFAEIAKPARASQLDRLVIAGIPDLPLAARRFAESLQKSGVRVEVLVWVPGEPSGGFDAWGRPDPDEWADCRIQVEDSQILCARSPDEEAAAALDFALAAKKPGDYALLLADPEAGPAFRSEVENRGGRAFLPDGGRLDLSEAGRIALEWERFRAGGDLRILRRLLELPRFNRVLRDTTELKTSDPLADCDYLIGEAVLSDFEQAAAFANIPFDSESDRLKRRAQSQALIARVGELRRTQVSDLLAQAWKHGGEGLETARKVEALHRTLADSPLYANDPDGLDNAFARALKSEPLFESSEPGDVELSGWLEAPWIDAERMALCGCVEGVLPSALNGHAFLPDSKRRDLGLADNASRFARDAYLFQCLLHARPASEFLCAFSRFDRDGSPLLPSRLFLRCPEEALPERVRKLFGDVASAKTRATRVNSWLWNLPDSLRKKVVKMSPTDFSEYLACPFRFYLKKVLYLDTFTPDAREMDAKRFGLLVHEALEHFGRQSPDEGNPVVIERLVMEHLDAAVLSLFGPAPSPAVRIQIEGARARLRAFARVQAEQFAQGWRIVATEKKLESESENPMTLGPLKISGKIDRIEKNEVTGAWRILDYKTYATPKAPSKQHFGSCLSTEWLDEAIVEIPGAKNPKKKRWADLQLPLYHKILHHLYGAQIGEAPVSTGYFLLCADPAETAVLEFTELTSDILDSALACAEAVTRLVGEGVFWPPQPPKGSWDDPFEPFFLNGKPESCLTTSTIEFLKGEQK